MNELQQILANMSLKQKIGQRFVFMHSGGCITPESIDMVTKLHVGGLQFCPDMQASFTDMIGRIGARRVSGAWGRVGRHFVPLDKPNISAQNKAA